jgi:hypothetical protein
LAIRGDALFLQERNIAEEKPTFSPECLHLLDESAGERNLELTWWRREKPMRKWRQKDDRRTPDRGDESVQAPRHSHIRELALPALKSVARFLSLDSYRSLPKHDLLPDLNLNDTSENAALSEPFEATAAEPTEDLPGDAPLPSDALLDWDELDIEELAPTPYRRYVFDLLIQGYLEQTREQLSQYLLEGDL